MTIKLSSVKQYVMSNEEYNELLANLNKPLNVEALNFTTGTSALDHIVVMLPSGSLAVLFRENAPIGHLTGLHAKDGVLV